MGQLMDPFERRIASVSPFYTLHVWGWKENPNGTFVTGIRRFHVTGSPGTMTGRTRQGREDVMARRTARTQSSGALGLSDSFSLG